MTETEIKEIVQKQRSYFYTGATLPVEKRLDALKKLKTCIQKYEPLINEALKRDTFLCKRKNSTDSPCPVRFQKL